MSVLDSMALRRAASTSVALSPGNCVRGPAGVQLRSLPVTEKGARRQRVVKSATWSGVRHECRAIASPEMAATRLPAAATVVPTDWTSVNASLQDKSPLEIMDYALSTFGENIAIAFSGAEDVALVEYAHLTGSPFRVFSLDTGRLNPETYELFESVETRYGLRIEYVVPEQAALEDLVRRKGQFSFYRDGHKECCGVRKVAPLRRMLSGVRAWITGQRQDQSPGTRAAVPIVQSDPTFGSSAPGGPPLVKFNPLAHMSGREVWGFLRAMDVPTNALHARGYVSIGCAPCTRAVLPGQHEREGRWWWEDAGAKECGLHSGNLSKAEAAEGVETAQEKGERSGREASRADREARLWALPGSVVRALSLEQVRALLGDGPREEDLLLALYAPWCRFCQALERPYEDLAAELHRRGRKVAVAAWRADLDREFANEHLGLETFPTILFFPKSVKGFVKYPSERRDVESVSLWLDAVAGRAQR